MVPEDELPLSKSEIKRQLNDIKELGRELSLLSIGELKKIPLSEEAFAVIRELQKITSNAAKKRQTQFVAKVLAREENMDDIKVAYEVVRGFTCAADAEFHLVEQWRENLMSDSAKYMTEFMKTYVNVSSQDLRHLIQKAVKERTQQVNHGAYRALFRYLKNIIEAN